MSAMASFIMGCGSSKDADTLNVKTGHVVISYVSPDSLRLTVKTDKTSSTFLVGAYFEGERIYWDKNGNNRFDSIAHLNRDEGWSGSSNWEISPSCAYPVKGLSIVSDADFDESHPAGSELCDLATVNVYSFGNYVLSGYKAEVHEENILKPFSEITEYERYLWNHNLGIYLPIPTLSRTHNLTVIFSFEGWQSVSSTVRVDL